MREIFGPPLRAAAVCALVTGLVLLLIDAPAILAAQFEWS